jgi:hypothetical protein
MRFIDPPRHAPTRRLSIRAAGFPTRSPRMPRQRLRERRRLAAARSARFVQLPLQLIDPLAQSVPFSLQAPVFSLELFMLVAQPVAFPLGPLRALSQGRRLIGVLALPTFLRFQHTVVMPESSARYKTR